MRRGLGSLVALALFLGCTSVSAAAQRQVRPACGSQPRLALEPRFIDPRGAFAPNAPAMRATQANFGRAYRDACRDRILRDLFAGSNGVLMLRNSPEANVASIFSVSINRRRGLEGRVLEYPFVTADGAVHVPSAEEIHEAIFCRAVGATAREQEDFGRCLPD